MSAELELLEGGEGRCWRAGDVVFKPCDELEVWSWLAEHLPTVKENGFRLPLPVASTRGEWVVGGWCAQQAVEGEHPDGNRWADVLHTLGLFHRAVQHLPCPGFIVRKSVVNQWETGDRVAWEEEEFSEAYEPLSFLFSLRAPVQADSQLIHGDFSENVLFSPDHAPAVIDISPYWRPVGFAYGIVVADAVCWRNANPEELVECVSHVQGFPQFLIRALIYRMVTTIVAAKGRA